ncbi:MAG: polyprenyl synthetase family protein [Desulfobacteraceae bacterium]|nr:MAG: polyprenyl synthetase family protein [Desulfobacteraceae bacterium]
MNHLKQTILETAAPDLAEIETALKNNLNTYLDLVSQAAGHILFSGGKRFRPLLMVLSARICGYSGTYDKIFSTIFEYLHTATLLHDDIVDEATLRRGKPVANSIWGSATAVLVGDFLLARSLSIAAKTNKIEVIQAIGEVTEDMAQGEIHQLLNKGSITLTEEEYKEVIRRKTASLIQGACRTGALIAEASPEQEKALTAFGLNLGFAFQMADDLLDYISDTETLGKTIGADLREGKMTLPLIHTLKNANPTDRKTIKNIIQNPDFSENDFNTLKRLLDTYGGIRYTTDLAAQYVDEAKKALSIFDSSKTKNLLMMLADYTLNRNL